MKKLSFAFLWVGLVVFLAVGSVQSALGGTYSGGSGTEADPYLISTAEDMQSIGANPADWGKHFLLTADIDLSAYTGTEFNIIGTDYDPAFTGVFDGNDHSISNFTYTIHDHHETGLFGYVRNAFDGTDAVLKDLTLINPNVTATGVSSAVGSLVGRLESGTITGCGIEGGNIAGYSGIGGLVGDNSGRVSNCYATASVAGTEYTGGLAGHNFTGTISNCYATGSVTGGNYYTGGLVGRNRGTISNCYSEASVEGTEYTGGLVGYNYGPVSNCYAAGHVEGTEYTGGLVGKAGYAGFNNFWDIEISGQTQSAIGTGKTTAEMKTASTFSLWAVCENQGLWTMDEGNDYPRLVWQGRPGQPLPVHQLSYFLTGTGTAEEPYMIHTREELNLVGLFSCEQDKHFRLANDIDLSGFTGTEFIIIGADSDNAFTGVFDGNGHTISNFTCEEPVRASYVGLFGCVKGANALIKDLHLSNPTVSREFGSAVGSLVGWFNEGCITGCSVTGGSVSGGGATYGQPIGGLVGRNNSGTISNCYAATSVTGRPYTTHGYIGGLVGSNDYGTISNCYATGSVTGTGHICAGLAACNYEGTISNCYATGSVVTDGTITNGSSAGLVSNNYGTISNCYATGSVAGTSGTASLVVYNHGTISNCYGTGHVSGGYFTGGLVAKSGSGGIVNTSFWDIQTTGRSSSAGGEGKTTAQMQMMSTFTNAGWDFVGEAGNGTDDIWSIHEGINYPVFVWEIVNFVGWYEVDMLDFAFFADRWMNTDCGNWNDCDGTDINFSDSVDMADLVIFANHWLVGK